MSLLQAGLFTEGILWTVNDTLLPSTWPRPAQKSRKRHRPGLNDIQRNYLFHLTDVLRISGEGLLAAKLERYLETDMTHRKLGPAKKYIDKMAKSVVNAMRTGIPLRIAFAQSPRKACGIFVGIQNSNTRIFTSWNSGVDIDGRWRESHVSIVVRIENKGCLPLLDTVEWVNGLFFFRRNNRTEVVFRWPQVWTEDGSQ